MTHIERARLKPGRLIEWQGRHFSYCGYAYKAHGLKEIGVSAVEEVLPLCYTYPSEVTAKWSLPEPQLRPAPIYEHLSNNEILNAMVEGQT